MKIMENENVNKKIPNLHKPNEKVCFKCKRIISPQEYYVESILTGKIICSDCDEDLLITGDIFYSIGE